MANAKEETSYYLEMVKSAKAAQAIDKKNAVKNKGKSTMIMGDDDDDNGSFDNDISVGSKRKLRESSGYNSNNHYGDDIERDKKKRRLFMQRGSIRKEQDIS